MSKLYLSMLVNLIIVCWTGYTVWWDFRTFKKDKFQEQVKEFFRYYTTNSNILSAFASAVVLISECVCLCSGQTVLPDWVMLLHFVGASAVTVTMLTVIFFLAPQMGWDLLYKGDSLYLHTLGPIFAILAFAFLEKDCVISFPLSLLGASTVVVYGILYLYLVVVKGKEAGGWPDFYGFNQKPGMWKITFPAMLLGGCAISLLLALGHNL